VIRARIAPPPLWFSFHFIIPGKQGFFNAGKTAKKYKKTDLVKQLPLKKTLIFLFLDFLRGIATAAFIRKHNK